MNIREEISFHVEGTDEIFASRLAAERYVEKQKERAEVNYLKFVNHNYSGQQLIKKHSLDDYGTWEIKGEDDNCDFGGHHYMPSLGFVEGTLEQAIRHATSLDRFYTWGGGGSITKQEAPKVLKL